MNRTEPESYQELEALPLRVMRVARSPRPVFARVIERPRWAAVMLLTLAVSAASSVAFMQTATGRQALVDKWERTSLAFGRDVSDNDYEALVAMSDHAAIYGILTALAGGPVLSFVVAGAIGGVAKVAGWAGASYRQVLAVVAHAGVILMLRQLVAVPLNYTRETLAAPGTLAQLLPLFDEASPPARFLGAIDLFVIWWLIVLGIGVALLYRRSTRATVVAFMGAYVAFAALLAISMIVTGGTV